MPIEISHISRQASEMKEAIYKLLKERFRDKDGHLYNWTDDGKEAYNVISKMTSSEVCQFICPSLTISPSQSMAIIPLQFGFSDTTPSKWRNSEATKSLLEMHNDTVSISNATSTSGNLVISGYILTKARMTTHRLRYHQSLRKQLPDTTPPFDILLQKGSPTVILIPHLVVQCGKSMYTPYLKHICLSSQDSPLLSLFCFPRLIRCPRKMQWFCSRLMTHMSTHSNGFRSLRSFQT